MRCGNSLREFQTGTIENVQRRIERDEYVAPTELAQALRTHGRENIPPEVFDLVCRHLEGKVSKRRGPKGDTAVKELKRFWVVTDYRRTLAWLQKRQKKHGLRGWDPIRQADWWQGPPHERAARIVTRRWFGNTITWRQALNIVSETSSGN